MTFLPAALLEHPTIQVKVLGQFASPYFVLGRQQRSTYTHVRLALLAPSGLVWLATWPSAVSSWEVRVDRAARASGLGCAGGPLREPDRARPGRAARPRGSRHAAASWRPRG